MQRAAAGAESRGEAYDSDSEEEVAPVHASHRAKPRRKAHQKPQGSEQVRQAFSKRKKGLVLKSYQLYRLTDAKVFMFVCNDKGSTWAYSTPGFGAPLAPALLKELREMAKVPDQGKFFTEVMPHPPGIAAHSEDADDRADYVARKDSLTLNASATASAIFSAGSGGNNNGSGPFSAPPPVPPPRQVLTSAGSGRRATPTSSSTGGSGGGRPTSTRSQTMRTVQMQQHTGMKLEPLSPAKRSPLDSAAMHDDQMNPLAPAMSLDAAASMHSAMGGPYSPTHAGFYGMCGVHGSPVQAPCVKNAVSPALAPGMMGLSVLGPSGPGSLAHAQSMSSQQQHMELGNQELNGSGVYVIGGGAAAFDGQQPHYLQQQAQAQQRQHTPGTLTAEPAFTPAGRDGGSTARMVQRLSTENAAQLAAMLSRELAKRRPPPAAVATAPSWQPPPQQRQAAAQHVEHLGGTEGAMFDMLHARLPRLRTNSLSRSGGTGRHGPSGFDAEEQACHSAPARATNTLLGCGMSGLGTLEEEGLGLGGSNGRSCLPHASSFSCMPSSPMSVAPASARGSVSGGGLSGLLGGCIVGGSSWSDTGMPGSPMHYQQQQQQAQPGQQQHSMCGGAVEVLPECHPLDDPMLAAFLEPQTAQHHHQQQQQQHHVMDSDGLPRAHAACGGGGGKMLHGPSRLGSSSTSPPEPMGAEQAHGGECGGGSFGLPHLPPVSIGSAPGAPAIVGGSGGYCSSPLKRLHPGSSGGTLDALDSTDTGSPLKRGRQHGDCGLTTSSAADAAADMLAAASMEALLGDIDMGMGMGLPSCGLGPAGGSSAEDDAVAWAMQAAQNGTVCTGNGVDSATAATGVQAVNWPVMA